MSLRVAPPRAAFSVLVAFGFLLGSCATQRAGDPATAAALDQALAASGLQSGSVGVTIRVNPDGSVTNCRVARSSGDGSIDALMCQLTLRYIRFEPARDPSGRPVAQDITFFPNWWRP